jgi:hypothetical protein
MKQSSQAAKAALRARNFKRKISELREYYKVIARPSYWEMWCRSCDRGFKVSKAPGFIQYLFNHATKCSRRATAGAVG